MVSWRLFSKCVNVSNIIGMAVFDMESFGSASTFKQLERCRKDDLL